MKALPNGATSSATASTWRGRRTERQFRVPVRAPVGPAVIGPVRVSQRNRSRLRVDSVQLAQRVALPDTKDRAPSAAVAELVLLAAPAVAGVVAAGHLLDPDGRLHGL